MKKPLHEICNSMVDVMHDLTNEPEVDSRMRIALFLAAQESIAKNMERLSEKDIEDYVYCATVLKLYQLLGQLLGKKAGKQSAISEHDYYIFDNGISCCGYAPHNAVIGLAGVKFFDNLICLESIEICGIDAGFQAECARFGLGGA